MAGIKVTATKADGGYVINGVKTWCTFGARADVLMLLARTDTDRSKTHSGLSMFIVPKPRGEGHGFVHAGGRRRRPRRREDGGPADRHDRLPRHALLRDRLRRLVRPGAQPRRRRGRGSGRASTPRWPAFENGRLQTAARAVGVMQAAYEAARQYAVDRSVFGTPVGEYQLTQAKLARMAVIIQARRASPAYAVARLDGQGRGRPRGRPGQGLRLQGRRVGHPRGHCRSTAAWATPRSTTSRYFVDAPVLSIFEGADETPLASR